MNHAPVGRIFAVDVESFGLHVLDDPLLEVGLKIYDLQFNQLDEFCVSIWENGWYDVQFEELEKDPENVVYKMHLESGLWDHCKAEGTSLEMAEDLLDEWLNSHNVDPKKDYLCGSSVAFDKYMLFFNMRKIFEQFHHRVIDISTIKVITELWFPNMAAALKNDVKPLKNHTTLHDINDSIEELRWYFNNVLPESDLKNV